MQLQAETITRQERKRLDRQRFIGWQTQRKLLNSKVLITPINGPNTQLAKNLILSGVNVAIFDNAIVSEDDFESNFLIAQHEVGQKRSEVVFARLKEMNPTGKNQVFHRNLLNEVDSLVQDDYRHFSMIATSTTDFELMAKWDKFSKKLNIPYYNMVCCGLYSFAFISLGQNYHYKEVNKKDNSVSKVWQVQSLSLAQSLEWGKADKNKEFIAAIAMMAKAQQQNLAYDPFQPDSNTLQAIVSLGVEMVGENHRSFLTSFAKLYGLDYCPVYSIVGSIASQQVIKIVENQSEPGMNWLVYNSEEGFANIVKLSSQKDRISNQVPENISNQVPENISNQVPENISNQVHETISNQVPAKQE